MSGSAHVDEALRLIQAETERFYADLESLAPSEWDHPSNCPPWTIRQLVGHQLRGAENYLVTIERALAGEPGEVEPREARTVRMNQIAAQTPLGIVADFRALTYRFQRFFGGLSAEQLVVPGVHSQGPRTSEWFVQQRLSELTFHRWDLNHSLGRPAELVPESIEFLLPLLIEQNFPGILARDKRGGQGSYHLAVRDRPDLAWQLDFAPGAVAVQRGPAKPGATTLVGDAAALGFLIYRRKSVAQLIEAGRLTVSDRAEAERITELFGGP